MSALLKSPHAVAALPLATVALPEPVADPRDAVIAALRQDVAQLQAAARDAAAAQAARIVEAIEQAGRKARDAVQRDDVARTALLEKALIAARAALDDRLALLDRLAPALAHMVLDRLFVASADRAAWVETMIARRLEGFRREAVVAVAVSAADVDDTALTALGERLPGVSVRHDPQLAGGQCRIEARHETLPLDLATEWATLAAVLDAMAEGRA
ncbi:MULTISPECIES: hypothetical protein [unclassified Sphingomonas]|uniref:hypothetical protein n=1 Tax=unclassified Sphingomonas TaxID=196159 RepID=UPI000B2CD48D|nr:MULTISPECIES: hypothetical protein [unclassified Sphingomonas]